MSMRIAVSFSIFVALPFANACTASSSSEHNASATDAEYRRKKASPLRSCKAAASSSEATPLLPTAAFDPIGFTSFDPGPLGLFGDRAIIAIDSTPMWMSVARGRAATRAKPKPLSDARYLRVFSSLSDRSVVLFDDGDTKLLAAALRASDSVTDVTVGPPLVSPCASYAEVLNGACSAHSASDGHVWVYDGSNFHEQVRDRFELRGGAPERPLFWDVDSRGDVVAISSGRGETLLSAWRLAAGTGGWEREGGLTWKDVESGSATIEGGFALANNPPRLAPDGSMHVFSDVHCIGTGDRNKTHLYLHSRDKKHWTIETLPPAAQLYEDHVTWNIAATWAADFERARLVVTSSTAPEFDNWSWSYPSRQYNVLERCAAEDGRPSFTRIAKDEVPGWKTRAFAGFSSNGTVTLLTTDGVRQIYDRATAKESRR